MGEEPLLGQLFILRAGTTMVGIWVDADAATGCEDTGYLDVSGVHQLYQIFHDDVHTILMKGTVVAEAEEVEFQALALHHFHIGNIVDADGGEVGLAGDGAEAGELGTVECDPVIISRVLVGECFQYLRRIVLPEDCLIAQKAELIFFHIGWMLRNG